MPRDADLYDFFVSYARQDNEGGWISGFVEELLAEHRRFTGGRTLTPFFDKADIRSLDDWQHRLHDGLAHARLFLAFISPNYFASPWCRREWRTWIDLEIAKHILAGGAAPIYIVEVPGLVGRDRAWKVSVKDVIKLDDDGNVVSVNLDIKNPNAAEALEHLPPDQLVEDILAKERRIMDIMAEIMGVLREGARA